MKLWVTGGAGYIGSVTTGLLLDAGHEVQVFDNLSRGHRQAIDARADFVQGDLLDSPAVEEALRNFQPDAVLHFAAFALVGESMEQPELYFRNNVVGGINLIDAMRKNGVGHIIFSSTCATYGNPERVPMDEMHPQRPENPYGESKRMLEKALRWAERIHGMRCVFLRYFNACGATRTHGEDHDPETHLVPSVLRVALGQASCVRIFGDDYDTPDGTCIRDYIHVLDLAKAHALALETTGSGAFNLGTGSGYSVRDVIDACRRVTGHAIPCAIHPRRPGDPPRLVARADRAERELKWRPTASDLDRIVRDAWTWHRAHPRGYESGKGNG